MWPATLATVWAGAPAIAADPGPMPVQRCTLDGFIQLPGSDVCLAISGYARLDVTAIDKNWLGTDGYEVDGIAVNGNSVAPSGVVPTTSTGFRDDTIEMYSEGRLSFDARSATDYGTVRAYVQAEVVDDESRSGGDVELRHAYVQFGNWLFGKTYSTILLSEAGPDYSDPYTVVGDNSTNIRRNQIRYTQPLGQDLSLRLAVEDQNYDTPTAAIVGLGPLMPLVAPGVTSYAVDNDANDWPDLVAALRWSRDGVGSWQVAGALHQNSFVEVPSFGNLPVPGAGDSDLGFALLFGLALDLPTGEGDTFTFLANYTDGASQYLQDVFGDSANITWGRCSPTSNCILDRVTKWSVVSSLTRAISAQWQATVGAGYAETNYGALGTATSGLLGAPGVLDVASLEIFANVVWNPVPKTTFMLDVHYGRIDFGGFDLDATLPGVQSAQGAWAATFEVTRRF